MMIDFPQSSSEVIHEQARQSSSLEPRKCRPSFLGGVTPNFTTRGTMRLSAKDGKRMENELKECRKLELRIDREIERMRRKTDPSKEVREIKALVGALDLLKGRTSWLEKLLKEDAE